MYEDSARAFNVRKERIRKTNNNWYEKENMKVILIRIYYLGTRSGLRRKSSFLNMGHFKVTTRTAGDTTPE